MNEQPTGFTDEEAMGMAEAAAMISQAAHAAGAGALVMAPYNGPPPGAEFFLSLMREMIEADGDATGCITIGCDGGESGMLPLVDVHPVNALHAILHVRLADGLPKVHWVTLAVDSYDLVTDDPNMAGGSAKAAFEAGDPDASEALKAICVAPDGPGYDVTQRYVRTGDGIEWGEAESVDTIISLGEIALLMNELVLA